MIRGRVTDWALALLLPVLLLVAYDAWARTAGDFFFPPLSEIGATFADEWLFTRIPTDLLPSLGRMLAGFALAVGGGVALGALLGFSRMLSTALDPVLQFLRALPPPALIPVSLLVFGAGDSAKVFLIALGAVWPVLLNTVDGVRGVDRTALDMARSYRVPAHARLTRLVLPAALPRIFAGARTALGIAIILMVVSELIGADNGVGYVVQLAQRGFDIPEMWAGTLLLGLLGFGANALFVAFEKHVLHWHIATTGRASSAPRRRSRRPTPKPTEAAGARRS
ncbi:ABC transporter permease [Pseudonocardia alaniniphila]|uniref:ABC transporter permease n=1 Tax=Pseudonocardia alaniniphila TaxID=75291 RepID=A0ABS9T7H8_9PSEU|nr:ABC transporter permease [Pseudonocardia alaniniphila]MCH6164494.1 ABC transporter permease [Pseudonocardia alaniniphila]